MALEQEIATYRRELPRLLREGYAGQYALIKGTAIVNIHPTQVAALEEGREKFGLAPIAAKLIDPRDVERFAQLEAAKGKVCQS